MTVQIDVPPIERRRAARFRFSFLMPATLGRGDAVILDISSGGARVTHFAGLPLNSQVRLSFSYAGERFAAATRVLASRVAGLGNGPGGTTSFESRLLFVDEHAASAALAPILEQIEDQRTRSWTANADGEDVRAHSAAGAGHTAYFLRCRLRGRHWEKRRTPDATQPSDGFTVPAKLAGGEVGLLCEAYEKMDDEGRALIRATASVAA